MIAFEDGFFEIRPFRNCSELHFDFMHAYFFYALIAIETDADNVPDANSSACWYIHL